MILNKRKIVLVGTGMVGMSFAYSALNQAVSFSLLQIGLHLLGQAAFQVNQPLGDVLGLLLGGLILV